MHLLPVASAGESTVETFNPFPTQIHIMSKQFPAYHPAPAHHRPAQISYFRKQTRAEYVRETFKQLD